MADKPFDLAIVGAGMAGCALAGKIAENGVNPTSGEPLRIALFDRGSYFKGRPSPGYGHPLRRQMFTNVTRDFAGRYVKRTGLPPGEKRKVPLQPGQEVYRARIPNIFGGGSLLYSTRTRAPMEVDFDVWVDETGADWSYQNLKPFGEQIHRDFNIHVRPDDALCRLDYLYRDAARSMGYHPYECTIAKRNCLLSGYCDGINMCKYDARQGSFVAYLPIAEEHGVQMIPDSRVERILFEKTGAQVRVTGVEYIQQGVRQTVEVPKVIVACGNYATSPLLYRSGYGPRELTDGDLVVENRNVGRNTDNRPEAWGPIGVFDEPVSDGEFRHKNAYYVYHDTDPDKRLERIALSIWATDMPQYDQVALNAAAPQFGRAHKEYMRDAGDPRKMTPARREIAKRCISRLSLVRPRNIHGWINEWGEQIYPGHDPGIIKHLEQARELTYELLKKMGAREILGMERPIRVHHLEAYVGSCIVGTDPTRSVVNPYFESHDIEGLFICDASVVPRSATQGFGGTVATVALFGASRIVERHFKRG
jgi:choline dehydrogenase-like flavoprotein